MLSFLKKGFSKTFEAIKSTARGKDGEVDKDELEEALLEADVDYEIMKRYLNLCHQANMFQKRV